MSARPDGYGGWTVGPSMDETGTLPSMADQIAPGIVVLGDDFSQHRIRGSVPHAQMRGMPHILDVPLISHVEGALYQGGCMNGVVLPDGFDFVLSLYPWEKYVLPEGCERKEVRMYDSLDQAMEQVDELAQEVADRLSAGQTCLVHCQAGLNRSGLLAARVLTLRGRSPADAIKLLRDSRCPIVLCNESFENWVLSLA